MDLLKNYFMEITWGWVWSIKQSTIIWITEVIARDCARIKYIVTYFNRVKDIWDEIELIDTSVVFNCIDCKSVSIEKNYTVEDIEVSAIFDGMKWNI